MRIFLIFFFFLCLSDSSATFITASESQNGLGRKGPYSSSRANPPPWAGTPPARAGFSKPS